MSRHQLELTANVALIAVVVVTLVVVLAPATSLGDPDGLIRSISAQQSWLVHAALFAVLGMTAGLRLATPHPSLLTSGWLLIAALLISAFATTGELAQVQVDGRSASVGDWTADLVGTSLGLAVAVRLSPSAIDWITRDPG